MKEDQYTQIVSPTIRGSHPLLHGKVGHLAEEFTSSMPYGSLGEWLLKKEKDADNPINDTFYIEGTSWDNVEILSEKVLKKWKRTMPPIIYQIEVMNKRIRQFGSQFYPSLTDKHFYTDSYEYSSLTTWALILAKSKKIVDGIRIAIHLNRSISLTIGSLQHHHY